MFKVRLNVANAIWQSEKQFQKGNEKATKSTLKHISSFMQKCKHKNTFPNDADPTIDHIRQLLHHSPSKQTIKSTTQELGSLFSHGSVYLVRHPEPTLDSYSEEGSRTLTKKGVKQGKELGEVLLDEILLCPFSVHLTVEYSPRKRCQLLGKVVEHVVSVGAREYDKDVRITLRENSDLYPGAVENLEEKYLRVKQIHEEVKEGKLTKPLMKELKEYFDLWVTKFPQANQIAKKIKAIMDHYAHIQTTNEYHITVLLTHENTIATVVYHELGKKEPADIHIKHLEYIKQVGDYRFYRDEWV